MGGAGGSAIVHDWFITEAGSEQTALILASMLPTAEVFTSFASASLLKARYPERQIHSWLLQRVPQAERVFRALLPIYPLYFSNLNLHRFELVVSSSVAFSHAVRTRSDATHIAYVYTPLRYAWDLDHYVEGSGFGVIARRSAELARPWLQNWDVRYSHRPGTVVAISETVRKRIARHWGRDAEVIYPPVDVGPRPTAYRDDGYLLVAARMLPYRRLDLAIDAAAAMGRRLIVVGDGPERRGLERRAAPGIEFKGWVDRGDLTELFAGCHAYIVPGVEDFGIAPVEAMAAGKPVIGFREGGVAETVIDGTTGVLFDRQDVDSVVAAIERLDTIAWDPAVIRRRAEEFSTEVFRAKWRALFKRLGVDPSLYAAE